MAASSVHGHYNKEKMKVDILLHDAILILFGVTFGARKARRAVASTTTWRIGFGTPRKSGWMKGVTAARVARRRDDSTKSPESSLPHPFIESLYLSTAKKESFASFVTPIKLGALLVATLEI